MHQPPPVPEHPDAKPPAPPHTPPTIPTGEIGGHRSTWPGVIGTLLCVFAGLGILQRIFSVIFTAIMPQLPLPPEAQLPQNLWLFSLAVAIIGLPLSFIHLMAGIQTLRRKPSARRWVIIFFVYVLVTLPLGLILQYMSIQHQMNVSQQQGGVPAGMGGFMRGFGVFSMFVGAAIALAWPTFLIIWYSRESIRREMAGWATAGSGR